MRFMHAGNVFSLVERTLFEAILQGATPRTVRPHIGSDVAASTRNTAKRQPRNAKSRAEMGAWRRRRKARQLSFAAPA
jgi:hypothetical protein